MPFQYSIWDKMTLLSYSWKTISWVQLATSWENEVGPFIQQSPQQSLHDQNLKMLNHMKVGPKHHASHMAYKLSNMRGGLREGARKICEIIQDSKMSTVNSNFETRNERMSRPDYQGRRWSTLPFSPSRFGAKNCDPPYGAIGRFIPQSLHVNATGGLSVYSFSRYSRSFEEKTAQAIC